MDLEKLLQDDESRFLDLPMGTEVLVQLDGVDRRMKSVLVGCEPKSYLIVRTPRVAGIASKLYEGNQVIIRYFKDGTIFGFQTTLLHTIGRPFPLMFLAYPMLVTRHELRKQDRIECKIPARASIAGQEAPGVIMDISKGGCRYSFKADSNGARVRVTTGDKVEISFAMSGVDDLIAFSGKVRNKSTARDLIILGLEFETIEPEMLTRLEDYFLTIKQLQADL